MNKIEEITPSYGQVVVAYLPDDNFFFARYTWVWTWKGKRLKFVNLSSKGFWKDDVIGWNRIPVGSETI